MTLHLTTLLLNTVHPAAAREARDLCRMHARVLDATSGMPEGPGRVLWAQPHKDTLMIRSAEPVTLDRLPAGWATDVHHTQWTPPRSGRHRAVVVVNPSRGVRHLGRPGSQRVPIIDLVGQERWLRDRLEPTLDGLTVEVVSTQVRSGWHRHRHRVTYRTLTARISGIVTDETTLGEVALHGLGHGRAYGCGLTIWERV